MFMPVGMTIASKSAEISRGRSASLRQRLSRGKDKRLENIRNILEDQLDTLFLQKYYPNFPPLDRIAARKKELAPVCVWSGNKLTELESTPSAPIAQNRYASFQAQPAQPGEGVNEQTNDGTVSNAKPPAAH